jgi:putative transposase
MSTKFSEEKILSILHEAEKGEMTILEICKKHGISDHTFYRWRAKYTGITVSEAQRLKELERENARLKRLLAERDLEIDVVREFLKKKP